MNTGVETLPSNVVLFYDNINPKARSVLLLINKLNIDISLQFVDTLAGEHMCDFFKKINPASTVPTLVDNQLVLFTSPAILAHLASKFGGDILYPKNVDLQIKIINMMFFDLSVLCCRHGAYMTALIRSRCSNHVDEIYGQKIIECYKALESFLKKHRYMASDMLSLADYSIIGTLTGLDLCFPIEKHCADFPRLARWFQEMKSLPEFDSLILDGIEKEKSFIQSLTNNQLSLHDGRNLQMSRTKKPNCVCAIVGSSGSEERSESTCSSNEEILLLCLRSNDFGEKKNVGLQKEDAELICVDKKTEQLSSNFPSEEKLHTSNSNGLNQFYSDVTYNQNKVWKPKNGAQQTCTKKSKQSLIEKKEKYCQTCCECNNQYDQVLNIAPSQQRQSLHLEKTNENVEELQSITNLTTNKVLGEEIQKEEGDGNCSAEDEGNELDFFENNQNDYGKEETESDLNEVVCCHSKRQLSVNEIPQYSSSLDCICSSKTCILRVSRKRKEYLKKELCQN